jgi:hypothetical protein
MRYSYRILDPKNKEETIEAMSFKKMLQSLVLKFPKQIVTCYYKNKKCRPQIKIIDTNKIKVKY